MAQKDNDLESEQAKQFAQLLKDYGIVGNMSKLSAKDREDAQEIFPD